MGKNYLHTQGRVDLFSQPSYIGFDLPSAKIAGIYNGQIAFLGGAVPIDAPPHTDAEFVSNIHFFNLSDMSLVSEFALYDGQGSQAEITIFSRVYQGAVWSENGTFTINYARALEPIGTTPIRQIALTSFTGTDASTATVTVPFEQPSYTSDLFELPNNQKLMIQSYGGDWRGYLIDETGAVNESVISFGNFYGKRAFPLFTSGENDDLFTWKLPQRDADTGELFFQIMGIRFNTEGQPSSTPLRLAGLIGDDLQPANIHTLAIKGGQTALVWQEIPNAGRVDRVLTKIQLLQQDGNAKGRAVILEIQDELPPKAYSFGNQLSVVELDFGAFSVLWHDKIAFFNKNGMQLGNTQLLPTNPEIRLNGMLDAVLLPNGKIGVYSSEFDGVTTQQTFEEIVIDFDFRSSSGNDWRLGTRKSDKITGKAGDDLLEGYAGQDILFGSNGADTLVGQKGNDRLYGGQGKDIIIGGKGNDTLVGGKGSDILTGGSGSDVFVFKSGSKGHKDHITDFDGAFDRLLIQNTSVDQISISHAKGSTTIEYDGGAIVLENISRAEFEINVLEFT